jgi:protein-S-isoprenylcysteine O-methyltransferase Ste14
MYTFSSAYSTGTASALQLMLALLAVAPAFVAFKAFVKEEEKYLNIHSRAQYLDFREGAVQIPVIKGG